MMVSKQNVYWSVLMAMILLVGCGRESMASSEYMNWIAKDESTMKIRELTGLKFGAMFKPIEYCALIDRRGKVNTEVELSDAKSKFKGMTYFEFVIDFSSNQSFFQNTEMNSEQLMNYFQFGMQQDFSLEHGKESLPCALYHFERCLDVGFYRKFDLAFAHDYTASNDDYSLIYDGTKLGIGIQRFYFDREKINSLPNIKF